MVEEGERLEDPGCTGRSRVVIGEIQMILAEKRTSLAVLRTGIAVLVLPLSVLSVLVTTSRYYDVAQVLGFLIPLLTLCACLVVLGAWLVGRSVRKIRLFERQIHRLRRDNQCLAEYIDSA